MRGTEGLAPIRDARASEARRLGNTQAITRCGGPLQFQEPLQLQEPMQLQSWVGIFAQHHTERRAHGRLTDRAMMKECR
jgi:hypothetical protein